MEGRIYRVQVCDDGVKACHMETQTHTKEGWDGGDNFLFSIVYTYDIAITIIKRKKMVDPFLRTHAFFIAVAMNNRLVMISII